MYESIWVSFESSLSFESESCFCLLGSFGLLWSEVEEEDVSEDLLVTIIEIVITIVIDNELCNSYYNKYFFYSKWILLLMQFNH